MTLIQNKHFPGKILTTLEVGKAKAKLS